MKIDGKTLILNTNQTSHLTKELFWDGPENFEYTPVFTELIRNVSSFYDIGANIGYFSLVAALLNPKIKVTSFEPANGPYHYLVKNVASNKLSEQIKIEKVALSDTKGEIEFNEVKNLKYGYLHYNLAGEGTTASGRTHKNFIKYIVPTTTLDEYVKQHQRPVELMKIDTEGTEHFILNGGKQVLEQHHPIVICETLFNMIEGKLEAIMKSYGYRMFNHVPQGLQEVQTIVRKEDNGVRNCFFVHPSRLHLIEKFIVA